MCTSFLPWIDEYENTPSSSEDKSGFWFPGVTFECDWLTPPPSSTPRLLVASSNKRLLLFSLPDYGPRRLGPLSRLSLLCEFQSRVMHRFSTGYRNGKYWTPSQISPSRILALSEGEAKGPLPLLAMTSYVEQRGRPIHAERPSLHIFDPNTATELASAEGGFTGLATLPGDDSLTILHGGRSGFPKRLDHTSMNVIRCRFGASGCSLVRIASIRDEFVEICRIRTVPEWSQTSAFVPGDRISEFDLPKSAVLPFHDSRDGSGRGIRGLGYDIEHNLLFSTLWRDQVMSWDPRTRRRVSTWSVLAANGCLYSSRHRVLMIGVRNRLVFLDIRMNSIRSTVLVPDSAGIVSELCHVGEDTVALGGECHSSVSVVDIARVQYVCGERGPLVMIGGEVKGLALLKMGDDEDWRKASIRARLQFIEHTGIVRIAHRFVRAWICLLARISSDLDG